MFKSIYFKIVLILVIFIITVMCVVGTVLLNSVAGFYMDEFIRQMENNFSENSYLRSELISELSTSGFGDGQKKILDSFSSMLGIDEYRNFYILGMNGELLGGSDTDSGQSLQVTPNMLAAMNRKENNKQMPGSEYSDYAVYLSKDGVECIIYVKDTLEEMQQLNWTLFSRILQSLFIGLIIAILLSFFLAKAITSPIQNLTFGAQLLASGEFSHMIDVHSRDEIGTLADTFNHMKDVLKNTIDEVDGERQKLETVFSYLKDAVIAFTDDGHLLQLNSAAEELFGVDGEIPEGFTLYEMLELIDISLEADSVNDMGKIDDSLVFREKVFGDKVLDVSFGAIRYVKDNLTRAGLITVIHDITNQYELDKSRREFVANVSHELRTPLTTIKGACETILEDGEMTDEDRAYFLEMAVTECDRMKLIVEDLLILSRLDNNRTKWQIDEFDVKELIRRRCESMQMEIERHNHKLIFAAASKIPLISADRQKIEQVIINIISNAIKYTPDGGTIKIAASKLKNEDSVKIQIADNGIGIPDDDLAHLFERFYRVEKSRTSDAGGTGLGLAIAKEVIEAHGGKIDIYSQLNRGTVVTIILPVKTKLS